MKRQIGLMILGMLVVLGLLWVPLLFSRNVNYIDITNELSFPEGNRIKTGVTAETAEARTLRGGTYQMRVQAAGEGNLRVQLSSNNCASLVPDTFVITQDADTQQISFCAYTEVDAFKVSITGGAETDIVVESVLLSQLSAKDRRFTISIILISAVGLAVLYSMKRINRDQMGLIILLTVIALLASIPCLKDDLSVGDDMYYHWERLTGLIAALRSGQFPVRLYPTMNNGYGGVAPVFYPDLFLYPLALLVMSGASMQYAFHLHLIAINILTVFAMYALAKNITKEKQVALVAAILYTLSPYRLTDLFSRSALGESLAMAFLPLLFYFLAEVICGNQKKWPLLSITAAFLFRAHMITTLFAAVLCLTFCLCSIKTILKFNRLGTLCISVVCTFFMCLSILLPLWTLTQSGVTAKMMMRTTAYKAIEPAQLFFETLGGTDKTWGTEHLMYRAIEIGVPLIVGIIFYLYEEIANHDRKTYSSTCRLFFVLGSIAAFMTTTWFPWERVDHLTLYISKYIQFPWRLILVTVFLFSIPAAKAYVCSLGSKAIMAVTMVCLCIVLPLEREQTLNPEIVPYGRTPEWMHLYGDYNFEGTVASLSADREVQVSGQAIVRETHRAGDQMDIVIETQSESLVSLPLYAFEGYSVRLNEQEIDTYRGENNRLSFSLPEGTSGVIHVNYIGNPVWRIGEAIGLVTFMVMILLICIKKKHAG